MPSDSPLSFFCPAPLGLELLLADELRRLGIADAREARAGAGFSGGLESAYRACLWSRLANRVLLKLAEFPCADPDALYRGVAELDWAQHMVPDATLAVDFAASRSKISHTQYGAQRVKDAIVDQFRESCGVRPGVRLDRPDVRINVYLDRDIATVSLDLSGESLHKRGYRLEGGVAPLKENLAAAILLRAGWPEVAAAGGDFVDPMCGSGTLSIEAAWMAGDVAPGLDRQYFGFQGWKRHDPVLWASLLEEAGRRRDQGLAALNCSIAGYDMDRRAIHAALENLDRAGLRGVVHIERRELAAARPRKAQGLLVVNPPYGERLGEGPELAALYTEIGSVLQQHFRGWKASVFTGNPELAFRLGIRARKFYKLYNGALECRLFNFEVEEERFFTPHEDETGLSEEARALRKLMRRALSLAQRPQEGGGAEMFANRLRKNLKNLGRWARQSDVDCYRLYDADLPEYAVAVDVYRGESTWLHVQEYEAPATVDPAKAEARLIEALSVLPGVLEAPFEHIFLKVRRRQKGDAQYDKQADAGRFHIIAEGRCRFWVNFEDYLDTGLFLDHRPTRLMIGQQAQGRHFLNLFGYTGTATAHAAVGGAASTTTVDMSRTYLEWARRNLELNGIKGYDHELIQADCLVWLEQAVATGERRYDLIFLDPPTFSNSKRMAGAFDIQRDHPGLIGNAARLLKPDGRLIFSTNARKFRLDEEALADLAIEDISAKTIPKDFERNPKIHRCWVVRT
jgi:23S rRNA (guanine2445-N2)-methyltransferase / 23S rRNA (guanine2069-N7)-methyltransferase